MSDILVRLETLERQNLRLRRIIAAALLVVAALLLMGQAKPGKKPEVIKAQAFELVDKNGKTVATFDGRGAPDRVELRIGDAEKGDAIVLAAADGDAVLQLQNVQGRIATLVASNKGPAVQLLDPSRDASATLGISATGPLFGLQDRGKVTFSAPK